MQRRNRPGQWTRPTADLVAASLVASLAVASWIASGAGCAQPPSRLNAPPQGHTNRPHELQEDYVFMVDNARLEDMSISSVHFVGHSAELNALGARRLKGYARILKIYGGELHYDGVYDNDVLAESRIKQIDQFLLVSGVPRDQFSVERGLAGGAGMVAQEARDIREATNFNAERLRQQQQQSASDGTTSP